MTKRNQKQRKGNSTDRSFEAFLKYHKRRDKGFKEFSDSLDRLLECYRLEEPLNDSNCELSLSEEWGRYVDAVSSFMKFCIERQMISAQTTPKQFVLSHPYFKDKNTGNSFSFEKSLDIVLSKWENGIIDFKLAAELCEAIITDIYCSSLCNSTDPKLPTLQHLYHVLMLKSTGAAFHRVIKGFCDKERLLKEYSSANSDDGYLAHLFLHTMMIAASYLYKTFAKNEHKTMEIIETLNNNESDFAEILFGYIQTYQPDFSLQNDNSK